MKKLIYLLAAFASLLTSCSSDEPARTCDVEVVAQMPVEISRAAADLNVDKVVCALFENGTEITSRREVVDVSSTVSYKPTGLIYGCKYVVVFWAMKDGAYNVADLTNITQNRTASSAEDDFDVFTAYKEFEVKSSESISVTLTRPQAKLNMYISQNDLDAVTELGYTLTKLDVTVTNAYDAYDALSGKFVGEAKDISYSMPVLGDKETTVGGRKYRQLSYNYVMTSGTTALYYTVSGKRGVDAQEEEIVSDMLISNVPFKPNYNVNVLGDMLTGGYDFTFTLESTIADE